MNRKEIDRQKEKREYFNRKRNTPLRLDIIMIDLIAIIFSRCFLVHAESGTPPAIMMTTTMTLCT